MTKVLDCGLKVSEYEFESNYYVHFQINTPRKGMNSIILSVMD